MTTLTHPRAFQAALVAVAFGGANTAALAEITDYKFELIDQEWALSRQLALAGIRSRYPNATDDEIQWQLAILFLGRELAEKAYSQPRHPHPEQS